MALARFMHKAGLKQNFIEKVPTTLLHDGTLSKTSYACKGLTLLRHENVRIGTSTCLLIDGEEALTAHFQRKCRPVNLGGPVTYNAVLA